MRKFYSIALSAIFVLVGCESIGMGLPKMDSEKAVTRIAEYYSENIDTDNYKPFAINWMEKDELSNDLGIMSVDMVGRDGNVYSQVFIVAGDNQLVKEIEESRFNREIYDFESIHWLPLSELDAARIIKQFDEAKDELPEDFKYKAIQEYSMKINPNSGERNDSFTLAFVEKGNAKSMHGTSIVTTYYTVEFKILEDGSIEAQLED